MNKIILAKAIEDIEFVSDHGRDLGRPVKTKVIRRATAVNWCNRGSDADIAKARAFADSEGYTVFVYPTTECKAFELAKQAIMSA